MATMQEEQDTNTTKVASASEATDSTTTESQYISGMKLYALMASLVLCFFLIMLDMSIVATVCFSLCSWSYRERESAD